MKQRLKGEHLLIESEQRQNGCVRCKFVKFFIPGKQLDVDIAAKKKNLFASRGYPASPVAVCAAFVHSSRARGCCLVWVVGAVLVSMLRLELDQTSARSGMGISHSPAQR